MANAHGSAHAAAPKKTHSAKGDKLPEGTHEVCFCLEPGGREIVLDHPDIKIVADESVRFTNSDKVVHNVSFDKGESFDIEPGEHHDKKFPDKGTWSYSCKDMPTIHGTVAVS